MKGQNRIETFLEELRGFTLIELILVIAILGVLAVAALPQIFGNMLTNSRTTSMNATQGSVQTAIMLWAANQVAQGMPATYPATLDSASAGIATATNLLFSTVLQNGINAQWFRKSATCYVFDTNGNSTMDAVGTDKYFQYTPATGVFTVIAAGC